MADIERGVNPENFSWQPPTQNVDGSAIDGPLSYNLYRGDDENSIGEEPFFTVVGELQDDGTYVAPIADFPEGSHVIALTAVDAGGDESALSNTMGFTISIVPLPPTLLA